MATLMHLLVRHGANLVQPSDNSDLMAGNETTRDLRVAKWLDLAASLVDELVQPLQAILSNIRAGERTLESATPDKVPEILKDLRGDTLRVCEIVREIRDSFSGPTFRKAPLQLNSLIEDLLPLVAGEARTGRISLMADLARDLPEIQADGVKLERAILNLLTNAMEAMAQTPLGDRPLVIATRFLESARLVEISVTDRGPGIPSTMLPHIFDLFVTSKPKALGVGLPFVRSIAELHQGTITAENNRDGGATFRLRLRMEESQPADDFIRLPRTAEG
jgi:C4-dicarboxylate-specific signal transduction histidine kinase